METEKNNGLKKLLFRILLVLEGVLVGFGAILPGVSGGTLCVAFGMYRPIIETLSSIRVGLKKYWLTLGLFAIGILIGFVGLSGLASFLMEKNMTLVICTFIGFILGTVPELWRESGEQGRNTKSYVSMFVAFAVMIALLWFLKGGFSLSIKPDFMGFLLCGVLWGLSFIVPGLSSSTLLIFFGLYKPMTDGIAKLDFSVLFPMGIGLLLCVLLLVKIVGYAYKKFYSVISHGVLGIVVATAVMIVPKFNGFDKTLVFGIVLALCGAVASYIFTRVCNRIKENFDTEEK